ncbi:jg1520, partial [Pararge aegeria aegeria]
HNEQQSSLQRTKEVETQINTILPERDGYMQKGRHKPHLAARPSQFLLTTPSV